MQTLRSPDVLVDPADLDALGFADRDQTDLFGVRDDGVERRAPGFRPAADPTTPGSAAA